MNGSPCNAIIWPATLSRFEHGDDFIFAFICWFIKQIPKQVPQCGEIPDTRSQGEQFLGIVHPPSDTGGM
jgi:hypothetical protein